MGENKKILLPFWFFTPLDTDNPPQPIATITQNGSATIIEGSLPINTEGEVSYIGVDYLSNNGANDITFNLLRDDVIVSTMSQKYLFQSFPTLIPLKLGLLNKTVLKVTAYNKSPIASHRIKMVVTGYYWYL